MVELKHSFPESFFEEEDRLGFHIDRKRKEIWAVELDMLYELDRVCKKLDVKYFLDGGTLLGAARDGRFIPWDDDIDVAMLREDYDRFVRKAPKEFKHPLFLQTGYTEPGYLRGHCQLRNSNTSAIRPVEIGKFFFNQGIFLDVFVLDELFDDRIDAQYEERELYRKKRRDLLRRYNNNFHGSVPRQLFQRLRYLLYNKLFGRPKAYYAGLEAIFRSYRKSEFVDYLTLNTGREQVHHLRREWYKDVKILEFEGVSFPAPIGYLDYLNAYYGEDWRTPKMLPSVHAAKGQVIFDVDRPYIELRKELYK